MYYCNIKKSDIADGPGVRVTLFVSGCTHHCEECFQPETWNFTYGQPFTKEVEEELMEYIESGQAEYIVENGENNIYNENDGTDNDLDYIIDEKYEEIGRNDSFVLMKRK